MPEITGVEDLLKPELKGKVALNGDPTTAGAAFSGVVMAAVANGGSADDISPGIDFFSRLSDAGNFLPVDPTPATIESGQTPVVVDWDYTNASVTSSLDSWKVVVPQNAQVGGYYYQAINADAPHPAAARLWQEFLYSDEGQNLWLKGGARPVRAEAMAEEGTIDQELKGRGKLCIRGGLGDLAGELGGLRIERCHVQESKLFRRCCLCHGVLRCARRGAAVPGMPGQSVIA